MGLAAANIGVGVTARTRKFKRGMRQSQSVVRQFGNSVLKMGKKVAAFGAVAGGAFAAGMTILVKRSFASIDVISKLSDALGIATEDIIGLQHAAEITGVGTETMNKSLEKMVKNIGEATTGLGIAGDTLEALGLDARVLAEAGPAEAFRAIADEINKLPTAAERANASYQIFGRSGVKLVNTLALGREGLDAMAAATVKAGTSFDRLSGAKVEAANDAITDLKAVLAGVGTVISVNLAPFVEFLADKMHDLGTAGEGVGANVTKAFESVLLVVGTLADWLELPKAGFLLLRSAASAAVLGIVAPITVVIQTLSDLASALGIDFGSGFASVLTSTTEEFVSDAIDDFKAAGEAMGKFSEGANAKKVKTFFRDLKTAADDAAAAMLRPILGPKLPPVLGPLLGPELPPQQVVKEALEEALATVRPDAAQAGRRQGTFGLRSLSEVGGAGGAKVLSEAGRMQALELKEERKQTKLLQKIEAKLGRGMRA